MSIVTRLQPCLLDSRTINSCLLGKMRGPPEPGHAAPTAFICEVLANQLQCKNPQTQEEISIAVDDIVCIRPDSGNGQREYSMLYLDKHDDQRSGDPAHIARIKTASLPPTLLSRYLWEELPAHFASLAGQEFRVHVIVSTCSGTGTAKSIYQNVLRPFLSYLGLTGYELHGTQSAETIKELVQSTFLPCAQVGIRQTIILLSGDGGLIDIIDTFYNSTESVLAPPCIALIPTGTGNAMANSVGVRCPIMGLRALLRGMPKGIPVFVASFSPEARYVTEEGHGRVPICSLPIARNQGQKVYGAVVASWGFHAALVADSDTAEYRKFGPDRFKLAATELLSPSDGSPTHSYRGVVTLSKPNKASEGHGQMEPMKRDEHMYALVTLVSRLEQEFVISPDSSPLDGCLRLIHFGPIPPDEAMQLMTKAYQGGLHVHEKAVTYTEVDRFRIDFREKEERWRRVCVDGKIIAVEPDGWMEVRREPRRLVNLVADNP